MDWPSFLLDHKEANGAQMTAQPDALWWRGMQSAPRSTEYELTTSDGESQFVGMRRSPAEGRGSAAPVPRSSVCGDALETAFGALCFAAAVGLPILVLLWLGA